MKTGVIVYVVGNQESVKNLDPERAIKNLNIKADKIEIVIPATGESDVMDAWWRLTTKGMQKVLCMTAEVGESSNLQLTGNALRLAG